MRIASPTRPLLVLLSAYAVVCPSLLWAQASLPLDQIVSRVEQKQWSTRSHVAPYSVLREYQLSGNKEHDSASEVIAEVDFVPPGQKDFSIRKVEGSGRAEKVVRKVLQHESDLSGHADLTEVTRRNYDFLLLGEDTLDGHRCYRLQLTPKRNALELVRGTAWVDGNTFLIRRIAGQPAKNPSWWIKDVQLTLDYAEIYGMWMQVSAKAVADVRWMGISTLTARNIDIRTLPLTAQGSLQRIPGRLHYPAVNAGTWMAH